VDALRYLLEASTRVEAQQASASARELGLRLTRCEQRRQRVKDAYVDGDFDLLELRKRSAALDAERASIEAQMGADEEIEIDDAVVGDLVDVFTSWRDLRRREKRSMLKSFGVEIVAERIGRARHGRMQIDRLRLNVLPSHVWLYK